MVRVSGMEVIMANLTRGRSGRRRGMSPVHELAEGAVGVRVRNAGSSTKHGEANATALAAEPVADLRVGVPGRVRKHPPGPMLSDEKITGAFRSKGFADLIDRDPAVAQAISSLNNRGVLTGSRSRKVSTRVDPGVLDAAKKRFGLSNESDVINASLAMAAAPDRFKIWLQDGQDTVTEDFELVV